MLTQMNKMKILYTHLRDYKLKNAYDIVYDNNNTAARNKICEIVHSQRRLIIDILLTIDDNNTEYVNKSHNIRK